MLFRMVPKPLHQELCRFTCFRAVLFRMVPKPMGVSKIIKARFRAVLFRMVPKQNQVEAGGLVS